MLPLRVFATPILFLTILLPFSISFVAVPVEGILASVSAILSTVETKHVLCNKGETYEITSGADLRDNYEKLECLFDLGAVPSKEPVGMYYGGILSLGSTRVLNVIGEQIWQGKIGMRTQCQGKKSEYVFIQNFILGDLMAPAYVYIGSLKDPIGSSERDNGKDYLFIDYSVNWEGLCPTVGGDTNSTPSTLSNIYPISSVIDVARVVGMTNDGGQIILGKTLYRDISNFPDTGDITIAWWFVINYDTVSYPEVIPQILGPAEEDFEVTYKGLLDENGALEAVLGLNGLAKNPTFALQKLIYFLTGRPLGIPVSPDQTELHNFLEKWPLAGNPLPNRGFELMQPPPDAPPYPKSGRRPGVPNTMGAPMFSDLKNAVAHKFTIRDSGKDDMVSSQENVEDAQIKRDDVGDYEFLSSGGTITGRPGSGVADMLGAAITNIFPDAAERGQTAPDGSGFSITSEALKPLHDIGEYVNYLPENTVAALAATPFGARIEGTQDQSMDAFNTVVDVDNAISRVDKTLQSIADAARSLDGYTKDGGSAEESIEKAKTHSLSALSDGQNVLLNVSETLKNLRTQLQQLTVAMRQAATAKHNYGGPIE